MIKKQYSCFLINILCAHALATVLRISKLTTENYLDLEMHEKVGRDCYSIQAAIERLFPKPRIFRKNHQAIKNNESNWPLPFMNDNLLPVYWTKRVKCENGFNQLPLAKPFRCSNNFRKHLILLPQPSDFFQRIFLDKVH